VGECTVEVTEKSDPQHLSKKPSYPIDELFGNNSTEEKFNPSELVVASLTVPQYEASPSQDNISLAILRNGERVTSFSAASSFTLEASLTPAKSRLGAVVTWVYPSAEFREISRTNADGLMGSRITLSPISSFGGNKKITAKVDGVSASCTVKLPSTATSKPSGSGNTNTTPPNMHIYINHTEIDVAEGIPVKEKLTASIVPHVPDNKIKWTSSNPWVAEFNSNSGTITTRMPGTSIITATSVSYPHLKASCKVNVYQGQAYGQPLAVQKIVLNKKSLSIQVGETAAIPYTIYPYSATNKEVLWSSDSHKIASVHPTTGVITGESPGSATVTVVTPNGKVKDTCRVIVTPNEVKHSISNMLIYRGADEREDYATGDKSYDELHQLGCALTLVMPENLQKDNFLSLLDSRSTLDYFMSRVAGEMGQKFLSGSGGTYVSDTLNQRTINHPNFAFFADQVVKEFANVINEHEGDASVMVYREESRGSNPLISNMRERKNRGRGTNEFVYLPSFSLDTDNSNGLGITVHGIAGAEVSLLSYVYNSGNYNGRMSFYFWDCFGLDDADIAKVPGSIVPGFKEWYVLQHYDKYESRYKPFKTVMQFTVSFSGNIYNETVGYEIRGW
jgi:hypothetical protein